MTDHRQKIIETGLAILREQGLAGLTQPRIAGKTGLRQSHLTYYYPTRTDLLAAVARAAVEAQLTAVRSLSENISSAKQASDRMAAAVTRHENTRVLAALNQAADQEPAVKVIFNELLDGFTVELVGLLEQVNVVPTEANVDLLHAVFVGLAIIDLATTRKKGKARAGAALQALLGLMSGDKP